jgi:hypothetical protein
MYSARTGQCRIYNGMTNFATPFVRSSCFEPAYLSPMNDNNSDEPRTFYNAWRNIQNNDSTCGFNSAHIENPLGPDKFSSFDGRNSLWRRENSVIVGKAPRNYTTERGETCPQQPVIAIDETGQRKVLCPILTSANVQPQCATCINVVFACDRYKDIDPEAYEKCRAYQRSIHYNVVTPNGQLYPMCVEMTNDGFDTYHTAMKKCAFICANCSVKYPSMDYQSSTCSGPNY